MKKVLILGAGMVARPIVQYLLNCGYELTVADYFKDKAKEVIGSRLNGCPIQFDVNDKEKLDKLVSEHDITVSLIPYIYHPEVARCCIKHKKNMLTASYVSQEMKSLDKEAKEAGILILNEMGLDPGIDHMGAKRIIDLVHSSGGKVDEFYSLCGALPAPESADNPFRYKFSWSPKGVLMASNNSAKYKMDGHIVNVSSENLFKDLRFIEFGELGKFEVYPNRDSLPYIDLYGIPEASTVMRGTIRYPGWSEILDAMKTLDLLSTDELKLADMTYAGLMAASVGISNSSDIKVKMAAKLSIPLESNFIKAMEWLGLFEQKPINKTKASPFDIIGELMMEKMMIGSDDRDMVLMLHAFKVTMKDGSSEVIRSKMVDYGSLLNDTAIARTVALPAAIGVKMILENRIAVKGVHIPIIAEIYNPVLQELEKMNIRMEETFGLKNCAALE
jgi:saccharopine dehydrogenase-like NADP-dependent oxidoreductase